MTSLASAPLDECEPLSIPTLPEVVVCIPAFNEARTIGRIVRLSKAFATHVLVCDDGSRDDTSSEAFRNGALVVRHDTNLGKGAALRTLLRESSRLDPQVIVTLDGDGQHDPSQIPELVTPILEGMADMVIGSRFSGKNKIPLYRWVGNLVLSTITNWSAGTRIRDTQSGFRAYSSRVILSLSITENGMGVDSEILIIVAKQGFEIVEKNVSVSYLGDTSTFNPLSHALRVTWCLLRGNYHRLWRVGKPVWAFGAGSMTAVLFTLGLLKLAFPRFGFGVSVLMLSVGFLIAVLRPQGKLIRWIRKAK